MKFDNKKLNRKSNYFVIISHNSNVSIFYYHVRIKIE